MGKVLLLFFFALRLSQGKALGQMSPMYATDSSKKISLRLVPQNFYSQHLSFVCRKEVQLQKLTSLPIFIRLGSKDYVDYLEKKPNAMWKPQR